MNLIGAPLVDVMVTSSLPNSVSMVNAAEKFVTNRAGDACPRVG